MLDFVSPPPKPIAVEDLLAEVAWLRALARRLVRDAAAADDLTQGTLVAALEHPPAATQPLRPWLAAVLRNLSRAGRRSDRRRADREFAVARREGQPDDSEALAQFEEQRRLAELVARLDDPHRLVIVRHFFGGESCAQIARATGRPAATVRSQLARGLDRLRELHRRECGGSNHHSLAALSAAAGGAPSLGVTGVLSLTATLLTMKLPLALAASAAVVLAAFGIRALLGEPAVPALADAQVDGAAAQLAAPAVPAVAETVEAGAAESERRVAAVAEAAVAPAASEVEAAPSPSLLTLRAIDGSGAPIAGATVSFQRYSGQPGDAPPSEPSAGDGRVTAAVDRSTTFGYARDDDVRATVLLAAPGFASTLTVEVVALGGTCDLGDRVLAPGGDLAGRVVDADGLGVEGAEVVAAVAAAQGSSTRIDSSPWPQPGELHLRTTSGAGGTFALDGVQTLPTVLWYRLPGRRWSQAEPFEPKAGERRGGIELVLPRVDGGGLIAGQVFAPDGTPAAGVRVKAHDGSTGIRLTRLTADEFVVTGDDGRFELEPLVDAPLGLYATDPEREASPSPIVEVSAGATNLALHLQPRSQVELVVVDADGAPVAEAWSMCFVEEASFDGRWSRTGEEGRVELLLPSVEFQIRIGCDGFESRWLGPFAPGALAGELEVVLERKPSLSGRVVADGQPVAGAEVALVQQFDGHRLVFKGFTSRFIDNGDVFETDAEGRFTVPIDEDSQSDWALLVSKAGLARSELILGQLDPADPPPEVTVEMTRGGTLEGRVVVGAGRTAAGRVVACSREDGCPFFTRADGDGFFRFENLTPGGWLVEDRDAEPEGRMFSSVSSDDMPFEPNVTVIDGEVVTLRLDTRWKDELSVRGSLRLDGEPAADWTAFLDQSELDERPTGAQPIPLAADGSFELPARLGPASLVLRSSVGGVERSIERRLTVGRESLNADFDLTTGGVRGTGYEPGAELLLARELGADGFFRTTVVADGEGSFEVAGVLAGEVKIMRKVELYMLDAGLATVVAGEWAAVAAD